MVGSYICLYRNNNEYEFYSKGGALLKDVSKRYIEQFHKKLVEIEDGRFYRHKYRRRRCGIYKEETPSGCGEGWSCSNCPNAGCPANELN